MAKLDVLKIFQREGWQVCPSVWGLGWY